MLNTLLLLCMTVRVSVAYSRGPPPGACSQMTPNHGPVAQTSNPPYEITIDANCYSTYNDYTGLYSITFQSCFLAMLHQK